ncbi:energy-coupling factor transport system permease protein [Fervidobacterium changbaicum]|uniref:Energy-coupling factor transporter transmembrane protein EcfT n=2 Tax=Fervidobacterium TaxID=2422 RepID=A0AAI8GCQ1_FERIS|nr:MULTISPECIES: energy-coupling factor transporter transmembrane protein EcfT [Fervidobacterium]AMW32176.1 energy-coupling factor transporter transmembrane protein EcfT [Fervidobacterium islandicum]QAV32490.1 energy-coupling factor transporter transmembrane protein EcfT [Fervidobacterium changbaicum]SDH57902.1 energy-coupling factor transport system permease protein [Fervidobacterium changbaicum]
MKLTIGKYIPKDSPIHQLDPRVKMISVLIQVTSVMLVKDLIGYIGPVAVFVFFMLLSKIRPVVYLRSLKSMWFLIVFAVIVQYFIGGITSSIYIGLRLSLIFLFATMFTYTTPPLLTARGIVDILKYFGVKDDSREDFGMMLAISIRFIPILLDEADRIIKAQISRGAKYSEKGIKNKLSALTSIIIPLLVSSLRKAEELSLALQARKYGVTKRSHYYTLSWSKSDTLYLLANIGLICTVLAMRIL